MKGTKESLEIGSNSPGVWLILLLGEKPEADRNPPVLYHNSRARSTGACNCGRKQAPRDDPFDIKAANYDFYQVTIRSLFLLHWQSLYSEVTTSKFLLTLSTCRCCLGKIFLGAEVVCVMGWPEQAVPVFTSACTQEHLFTLQVCWFMWILNSLCLWDAFPSLLWLSHSANLLNLNRSCCMLWLWTPTSQKWKMES